MKYIQGTFYKRPFFNKKGNNTRNTDNIKINVLGDASHTGSRSTMGY